MASGYTFGRAMVTVLQVGCTCFVWQPNKQPAFVIKRPHFFLVSQDLNDFSAGGVCASSDDGLTRDINFVKISSAGTEPDTLALVFKTFPWLESKR